MSCACLIQVSMSYLSSTLVGGGLEVDASLGTKTGAGSRAGVDTSSGVKAEYLASFLRQTEAILSGTKSDRDKADLCCLLNRLTKLLVESFKNYQGKLTSQVLVTYSKERCLA